ncbi:MAG: exosortase/archaeosortase family protein [Candidatus Omnitrophota bacterium]
MRSWWKTSWQPITAFFLCALAYVPTMMWMKIRWFTRDSYYSHGVLVPVVVAYLIWAKRDKLRPIIQRAEGHIPAGTALIISGLLIHLISSLFRVYFTSGFSMLVTLIGLLTFFWGFRIVKLLMFPLAFLIFMIPLPSVAIKNISFEMKMLAAAISTDVIRGFDILAVREGSTIRMPHANVVVDDVCSGLRSLISLMALGSLFAYWLTGPVWKRWLLFLFTIPIAVMTNVVRVVFLSLIAEIWGPGAAGGIIHDISGFGIFAVAFLLLLAVMKLME